MLKEEEVSQLRTKLREVFSDYIELAGGKDYRYFHLVSAHKYAKKLMETEEISELEFDVKVVEVAVLFHDIGRSLDINDGYMDPFEGNKGHDERGAEIVSDYVKDYLSQAQMKKVEKIILNHHSKPRTVEGKIVQDADELFKFGVHDFWRMFHYSAKKQRTMPEMIEYFHGTAVEELEERLEEFHFRVSRRTAEQRMQNEKMYLERFEAELEGEDILEVG